MNYSSTTHAAAYRWLVLGLLMGFAALGHFNRIGISVAGTEIFIQDGKPPKDSLIASSGERQAPKFAKIFSETEMGWIYTAFLVVYTSAMLPGGWLIDRIGAARALTLLGLTMGSFVALTGTLGWLTATPNAFWLGLVAVRGAAGLCSSPLHPGAAHVVSDVTTVRSRTTGNGLVTAGALLGIAFTYPLFGAMIDWLTWQWAFVVSGLVLIGYGVVWGLVTVRRLSPTNTSGTSALDGPANAELARPIVSPSPSSSARLLANGNLWLVTLSYVAYSYFQYLFFYWMSYYFKSILNVSDTDSRRAAFAIAIAQGFGMALGGIGNDALCRACGVARGRRSIMLGGMGISALFALIAVCLNDYTQVMMFMAIAMGSQGICEGIFWTTATEIGGRSRGFAGAFMNTGGNVGGMIAPVMTPILAESMGWPGAIAVACAICAVGGLIWFAIRLPIVEPTASEHFGPDP
jgi:MFS family permease